MSRCLEDLSARFTDDEWLMPGGVSFETLERAGYFESFPQWLTGASHFSGDDEVLSRVARSLSPGDTARRSFEPASAALPPAICYHTYAALRGRSLMSPTIMTAEEVCWRHERERLVKLERGWAFTMREIVCLADTAETEAFRQQGMAAATAFAAELGLSARIEVASDPFFAPTSRGKALLQRVKSLKHEMLVDYPDGRSLAIASFNNHERFFGDAFDISLGDGSPASSACVAFGVERWMLAVLMAHGVEAHAWPEALLPGAIQGGVR
jgi:seryl-tRNA synthetase